MREGADTPWNGYREGRAGTCSTMNMRLSAAESGSAVLQLGKGKWEKKLRRGDRWPRNG
jgi:hypothetical protein